MADYERELGMLPEDCISCILCRTSPLDAFHLSLVSSTFRSAAGADSVWEGFLPSDYAQIVAKSTLPLKFSSKKDLFLQLCNSILIDDGNKSFALEKSTGLKSYMLSARELSIRYGYAPDHWAWKYTPESRFAEVAELKTICRLEIQGKIRTETLSPNTKYGAYMVMKMTDGAFGLDAIPCEMSVAVGNDTEATGGTAYLRKPAEVVAKQWLEYALYRNRKEKFHSKRVDFLGCSNFINLFRTLLWTSMIGFLYLQCLGCKLALLFTIQCPFNHGSKGGGEALATIIATFVLTTPILRPRERHCTVSRKAIVTHVNAEQRLSRSNTPFHGCTRPAAKY
nr:F-box protein PP2-B15-like [Ipomoea batatas]